jgi:hypothetical protein
MQDFTGVPCVVDLAAMREAMKDLGGDPAKINPLAPAELVIDHSVIADHFGTPQAADLNVALEYERNRERYQFLRWGQTAFDEFKVVPPGTGIVHQVNIENLARVVMVRGGQAYPDTCVGTDSHTTMVNGLGVLGWGVGGIEAEAAMLGRVDAHARRGVQAHRRAPAGVPPPTRAHHHRDAARTACRCPWSSTATASAVPLANWANYRQHGPEYGSRGHLPDRPGHRLPAPDRPGDEQSPSRGPRQEQACGTTRAEPVLRVLSLIAHGRRVPRRPGAAPRTGCCSGAGLATPWACTRDPGAGETVTGVRRVGHGPCYRAITLHQQSNLSVGAAVSRRRPRGAPASCARPPWAWLRSSPTTIGRRRRTDQLGFNVGYGAPWHRQPAPHPEYRCDTEKDLAVTGPAATATSRAASAPT